jgi:hypothetical protein
LFFTKLLLTFYPVYFFSDLARLLFLEVRFLDHTLPRLGHLSNLSVVNLGPSATVVLRRRSLRRRSLRRRRIPRRLRSEFLRNLIHKNLGAVVPGSAFACARLLLTSVKMFVGVIHNARERRGIPKSARSRRARSRSASRGAVGANLPEPRIVIDDLDLLAT